MESRKTTKKYLYGDGSRSTVQIVLDAVMSIEHPATQHEIFERVFADIPEFKKSNMFPDLSSLTVNCASRSNYAGNKKARKTDEGNPLDKLFRVWIGGETRYLPYVPEQHGIWELRKDHAGKLRPKLLVSPANAERLQALSDIDQEDGWSLQEDARRQVMALIVRREGQPAFRQKLLDAYARTCVLTGCTVEALLEAAHIVPYQGVHTNTVQNGLLLRADLHKLFDLHLLRIDPHTQKVDVHESLVESEYASYAGSRIRQPMHPSHAPSTEALTHHAQRCVWWLQESAA
ncbi:HNH endonuclease [Comamonas sp. wu1-DMT]|uniref:HNH endonuclease n=1 Tax=Comamonas sp. wu1-DMT TaxID=3126390 RepID=UPI0032E509A4